MQKAQVELFTGTKGVRLEDLPEEAWRVITGDDATDRQLWGLVGWLYRCVDVRASAVANMPWEITRGETVIMTDEDDAPEQDAWLNNLPDLLYRTEAALALTGRAYWFKERNLMRTLGVRWLRPDSVKPVLSAAEGLTGFTRRVENRDIPFEVDDLVYFWLPDPDVEIGPAANYPGKAALAAAGVLHSMDVFLDKYFERGMVKATLLTYDSQFSISEDERSRVKEWWQRMFSGLRNAFTTEVLRGEVKPVIVGEGLKDLQNTALTVEQREDIATAFGVPQSKVTANAANFATKQGDDLAFIQDKIGPECRWLASQINRQLLAPMGLRLRFKPDELSIMQEDESQRAQSLLTLVNAGMSLEMATTILGYDLPEDMELREPAAATPPQLMPFTGQPVPAGAPEDDERDEEEKRFLRWAKKRANPDPDQFESVVLSRADKVALLGGGVATDAPFQGDWSNYP